MYLFPTEFLNISIVGLENFTSLESGIFKTLTISRALQDCDFLLSKVELENPSVKSISGVFCKNKHTFYKINRYGLCIGKKWAVLRQPPII